MPIKAQDPTNPKNGGHESNERSVDGQLIPNDSVEGAALRVTADPPDCDDLRYHPVGDLIVEALAGEVFPEGQRDGYSDCFEQATLRALAVDLRALVICLSHDGYAQETEPLVELSAYELRSALARLALRASAAAELGARMRRAGRPEAPEADFPSDSANGNGRATAEVQ
jgi:hypothetical protein